MEGIVKNEKRRVLDRPVTGVIHEDRIWESWYDEEVFQTELPKLNQTDYMLQCNESHSEQAILNNRGMKTITVGAFKMLIEVYAKALKAHGVKEGDVIATIALTTPELIALKYACAEIGAITANLNFKDAANGNLEKQLDKINPKIVFVLDLLENVVSDLLNKRAYSEVKKVMLPLEKSTPLTNTERLKVDILKIINTLRRKTINGKTSLRKFLGSALNYDGIIESVYSEGLASNIAFTSGTTGINKAVLLSHDANNALAWQHKVGKLNLKRGEKNLALVPPFLAIWDADIIHAGMCIGFEEILELELSYENIPKLLKKYLPNYGIWSQFLWDSMLTMTEEEIALVAPFLKKVVVGGERADANQTRRFHELTGLYEEAGYGCTELDSCFTVAHPNCNVLGSAGIPLPYNNVRIRKDGKDLTYNERGFVYLTGPCLMNGYYKDPQLTESVMKDFNDGNVWYDTKDYGYVDETGSLTILDRYFDPITIDAEQIQKADIAELINGYFGVKICKVDYYNDTIVCHVVLDNFAPEGIEALKKGLVDYINQNIATTWQPHIINFIEAFPRTPLGKVDYLAVAKMTKDVVDTQKVDLNTRVNVCQNGLSLILSK